MDKIREASKIFYETGESILSLSKRFDVSVYLLKKYIIETYNIDLQKHKNECRMKRYQNFVIEFKESNESMQKFCKRHHITERDFRKILDKEIDDNTPVKLKDKYQVNSNIFDKINTQEKAYWLGFLYADGYNSNSYIQLTISKFDINHLKKYRLFMNSTHPIHYREVDNTVNITISDKNIATKLALWGCVKGKTYCDTFPDVKTLPRVFVRDFVRGFFDGDGCINKVKAVNRNRIDTIERQIPRVSFTIKREYFADRLINEIKSMCGVTFKKYYRESADTYEIYLRSENDIRIFLDCIYKEATVYLDRKYELYLRYILPSSLEIEKIISAELSGKILPSLYDKEEEIHRIIRTEGALNLKS